MTNAMGILMLLCRIVSFYSGLNKQIGMKLLPSGIRYAWFAFDANLTSRRKAISISFSCSVKNIKNDEAYWLKVFDIKPQNKMNRNDYHQWLAEIDYPVK